ncbi:MAG: hypothetical protein NTV44_03890 [Firmicutes bacterium]|nr:hypothetical protein [Bacillota bacterium]
MEKMLSFHGEDNLSEATVDEVTLDVKENLDTLVTESRAACMSSSNMLVNQNFFVMGYGPMGFAYQDHE